MESNLPRGKDHVQIFFDFFQESKEKRGKKKGGLGFGGKIYLLSSKLSETVKTNKK